MLHFHTVKFQLDTRGLGNWPAGVTVFHNITPLATRESLDELEAWCTEQFGPRGGTWGWSNPWLTFTDPNEAMAFRMRWT